MLNLRNAWYMIGWARDLVAGVPHAVTLRNEPLVVYRQQSGGIAALEDRS